MIIVDASVAIKWFVKEEGHALALDLLERESSLAAPDLIFPETANVFWKKSKLGQVTAEQANSACASLRDFFVDIVPSETLIGTALGFARQLDHPVYDCIYLACAARLATILVSSDARFIQKAKYVGLAKLVTSLDEAGSIGEPGSAPTKR